MSRTIAGYKAGEVVQYVPEAFDNRRDPTPVTITFRSPTELEKRRLLVFGESLSVKKEVDGKIEVVTKSATHVDRQAHTISELVESVRNYQGRDGPITNGRELAEHGETEINSEVFVAIMLESTLTEDEEKKFSGLSDSGNPATHQSKETVTNAEKEG